MLIISNNINLIFLNMTSRFLNVIGWLFLCLLIIALGFGAFSINFYSGIAFFVGIGAIFSYMTYNMYETIDNNNSENSYDED